jgi:O-succinylbenzoate synthase
MLIKAYRYRRLFKKPVLFFNLTITERVGWLLHYQKNGSIYWGEIVSLCKDYPAERVQNFLDELNKNLDGKHVKDISKIQTADIELRGGLGVLALDDPKYWACDILNPIPITAFLDPVDPKESLVKAISQGYVSFKLKISHWDCLKIPYFLDPLWPLLKPNMKLRLDANQAFELNDWLILKNYWRDKPIEFIEEPILAPTSDTMQHCIEETLAPIALDEQIRSISDLLFWLDKKMPDYYIIKPILLDDLNLFRSLIPLMKAKIIYSTAFESLIGLRLIIRLAMESLVPNALGIGALTQLIDDPLGFDLDNITHFDQSQWLKLKEKINELDYNFLSASCLE